jgi:hypothetical protein
LFPTKVGKKISISALIPKYSLNWHMIESFGRRQESFKMTLFLEYVLNLDLMKPASIILYNRDMIHPCRFHKANVL